MDINPPPPFFTPFGFVATGSQLANSLDDT